MSSNNFYDYYLNENKNKARNVNIPEVQNAASRLLFNINSKPDQWLITKVRNHIERNSLSDIITIEGLLKNISNDIIIASCFAKPATKQNQSELCQIKYLSHRGIIVEKLPAMYNKAWRIVMKTGELVQARKIEGEHTHSFDFRYTGEKFTDYIMAKVTTTQGGGQTQQRQEMIDAIKYMQLYIKKHPDNNIRFVLLLDGDSYDNSGIDVFKQYESDRIIITNSDGYDPRV